VSVDVHGELRRLGASDDEIARAEEAGALGLLVVMYAALPDEPRYTAPELATLVGIDRALSKRLWRALGFPDVADDERAFTDADAEALRTVHAMLSTGFADVEVAVQMTRVVGSSMARVVEAFVTASQVAETMTESTEVAAAMAETALATQARLLEYVWRRHLQATIRRQLLMRMERGGTARPSSTMAVGFADLVGFTAMSQQLEPHELAKVVSRFEELAFEQVTSHGGRVAKMIGDEVMFVVRDAVDAVEAGLALAEAYADDEVLSDVRVGVACGDVLVYEGDYFGPVVNLASRIVNIAVPGSVVVSDDLHDALAGEPRFAFHGLRPRYLKDIGRVPLWRVRRRGGPSRSATAPA
jgi:adenylate cyclase